MVGSLTGSAGSAAGGGHWLGQRAVLMAGSLAGTDWVSEQCWLQDLQAAFLYLSSCRWFYLALRDC